jgi:hypothetical protein
MEFLRIPRSNNFSYNMYVAQTFATNKKNNHVRLCEFENWLPPTMWKIQLVITGLFFFN